MPLANAARLLCCLGIALGGAAAACGGGAGVTACDLSAPSCLGGATCDIFCAGTEAVTACRSVDPAPLAPGQRCGMSGDRRCPAGSGCFATAQSGGPVCITFCRSNADCATGTCQERPFKLLCGSANTGPASVKICL